jgi:hypothetical protein
LAEIAAAAARALTGGGDAEEEEGDDASTSPMMDAKTQSDANSRSALELRLIMGMYS